MILPLLINVFNLLNSVSETSPITSMELSPSTRVPLPLELNCEIFKCLKLPIRKKFIWGLGRDIYGMFGQKLLKKTKRVRNPAGNNWNRTNTRATITADGLNVNNIIGDSNVFAEQPFPISGPHCRVDGFPGTILYYYEVKAKGDRWCYVGLSDGAMTENDWTVRYSNSYAIRTGTYLHECSLGGEHHKMELPEGAIQPTPKFGCDNVYGCGLVLDPENKLAIFFMLNGKLMGRKIPISPTTDRLFPTITLMFGRPLPIVANFGGDPAKPFEYDIKNCPGLELACI